MTDATAKPDPAATTRRMPWILGVLLLLAAALFGYQSYRRYAKAAIPLVKQPTPVAPAAQAPCTLGAIKWHCRADL